MTDVFVVDRRAFFGGDWPQGFTPIAPADGDAFLSRALAAGRFEARARAEDEPAWKQWIPYCVLRATADPRLLGVFTVQRTRGQGESRLHGAWSIGIGGHIDAEDRIEGEGGAREFFGRALARELHEELVILNTEPAPRFVGLLNDDETPVGTVHAGLVYVWDLIGSLETARRRVSVRETTKMHGGFGSLVEFRELWQDPAKFESWSQFLIRAGIAGETA
ncbi:MAG: hypothetical protein JNK78_14000 [Planctomycetes bacterium]|nr:hypothetical protein [Planctomycetota bacterium]